MRLTSQTTHDVDGDEPSYWDERTVSGWFAALSTSLKLLLVMAIALAPLGVIAILAAIDSARTNEANRLTTYRATAIEAGQAVDEMIVRTSLGLRASGAALERASPGECRRALRSLSIGQPQGTGLALFNAERPLCWTSKFRPTPPLIAEGQLVVTLDGQALSLATRADGGRLTGVARFTPAGVARAASEHDRAGVATGLFIRQNGRALRLGGLGDDDGKDGLRTSTTIAGGQAKLELVIPRQRMTASEALAILLPIMMVVAAGTVAFLVMDRTVLVPLRQLQTAVASYRVGDRTLIVPHLTTPAYELRGLADAFRHVTALIVQHEAELEDGLARQTRLTREVHHRVKNNLQVVASLLNLHARGAASQAVADAYAAIQRRVDALAVVHRNHYAELEESKGIALRPLIGELAANLRATAPLDAASMPILLDLAPLHASQDVAVPIAFLITELVEVAMLAPPVGPVRVALTRLDETHALLSITAAALAGGEGAHGERLERVLVGLSRQLRAALDRDAETGRTTIVITVVAD